MYKCARVLFESAIYKEPFSIENIPERRLWEFYAFGLLAPQPWELNHITGVVAHAPKAPKQIAYLVSGPV